MKYHGFHRVLVFDEIPFVWEGLELNCHQHLDFINYITGTLILLHVICL